MPLVPRHLNLKRLCGGEAVVYTDQPLSPALSPKRWGSCSGGSNILKPSADDDGAHGVTRPSIVLVATLMLLLATLLPASATQVRDLVMVSGARDNQLVGYGLVAGLAGDGDKDPIYTQETVANMLRRYGITVPATTLSSKNVAVVMVTADIPAFVKSGTRLDVQVASMGDAKSLQGGVLLQTPLLGADNKVYAVAQGPLSIGGFVAGGGGGGGASVTKNHPTAAQIVNGAIVEREIPTTIVHDNTIDLLLREPSFTSASRLAAAINDAFTNSAHALDW